MSFWEYGAGERRDPLGNRRPSNGVAGMSAWAQVRRARGRAGTPGARLPAGCRRQQGCI